jgi:hypothetical protein
MAYLASKSAFSSKLAPDGITESNKVYSSRMPSNPDEPSDFSIVVAATIVLREK